MFEASGLMVFYENMLALNNVSLRCERIKLSAYSELTARGNPP